MLIQIIHHMHSVVVCQKVLYKIFILINYMETIKYKNWNEEEMKNYKIILLILIMISVIIAIVIGYHRM
jgi:hypothetical protein